MRRQSSRRLTGLNLATDLPAAVTEVVTADADSEGVDRFVNEWRRQASALCVAAGLTEAPLGMRRYPGGLSLTIEAPIDLLYPVIDLNDRAVDRAIALVEDDSVPEAAELGDELIAALAAARQPALMALQAEAARRDVPFLWDDDEVSVGHGRFAVTWPADALPEVTEVDWRARRSIPIALITGTNGKTTTSRMLARIAKQAGYLPGNTSSDGVYMDGELVEEGDWTGPGAARTVLRHAEVDFAVLETARGGILRRGLGVPRADAAIVTNVDADHLGEYGIDDVPAMAGVKATVGRVVHSEGRVVLCADEPHLAGLDTAALFVAPVVWFGGDPGAPLITAHLQAGGEAWLLEEEILLRCIGRQRETLMGVAEIPATIGGAARHNALNALGAAALASAVGIDLPTIADGLRTFGLHRADNPGRAEVRDVDGVRVILDFGHNPHGLTAMIGMTARMLERQPGRLFVSTAQAGDRSNEDIRGLCATIADAKPAHIFVRDLAQYRRGREPGEVPSVFRDCFASLGFGDVVTICPSEVEVMERALEMAEPGDLVLMALHTERQAIDRLLRERLSQLAAPPLD